jgi:beta-glucosidase
MRLRYWLVATTATVALSSGGAMAQGVAHPALWPAIKNRVAANPKIEARIKSNIARMSLEQKVGQVIQADVGSVTPDDVVKYHLGSILNGGNSAPGGRLYATAP